MDQTPTPLSQSSAPSPGSALPRSGWDRLLDQLPPTSVSLFALYVLDHWFRSLPSGDPLRRQVLYGLLIIAAPATVWSGLTLLRRFLADRKEHRPPS